MLRARFIHKGYKKPIKNVAQTASFFCRICENDISYSGNNVTAAIHSHKNRSSIHKEKEKEAIAKIGETMGDGIMCDGHISKKMKINNQFDDYEVRPDIEQQVMALLSVSEDLTIRVL